MNYRLVALLSMFGLVMSLATVFIVPPNIEPILWLVIFVICAVVLTKRAPSKAFLVSLLNCV